MNDLTPQTQNQTLTTTRCAVSLAWLACEMTDPRYPRTVTRSKILKIAAEPEIRQSLTALSEKYRPATSAQLAAHLARLSFQYWQPDQTETMNDQKWGDYCAALSGITNEVMGRACMAWLRSPNAFFPKPGQLLALVKEDCAEAFRRYRGLEMIAAALDQPEPPAPEPETLVSPERIREFLEKSGFGRDSERDVAALKEEILARKPLPYVETSPELKVERMKALERRLSAKNTG